MEYSPIAAGDIPQRHLSSGAAMPALGLGTFGSDSVSPAQVQQAVEFALRIGYRHLDCASVYGNEAEIGQVLARLLREGVLLREELWVTGKLWNNMHDDVAAACRQSLRDLQLDYLDLYLVHWPFPNHHPEGVSVESRDPEARPYIHQHYMRTWGQMEQLLQDGLVRHIGSSNMSLAKLELLLRDASIRPCCNEMELHPHFQQEKLFDYLRQHQIAPLAYSPLGSPGRPQRDRAAGDSVDLEDPVIGEIARAHGLHPAQLCLLWAVQRGQTPLAFSSRPANIYSNLAAVAASGKQPLSAEEMSRIAALDRNCRLIKGQVFLWPGARSWQDLWDEDAQA